MEVSSQVSEEKQQSGSDVEMATAPSSRGGSQGMYIYRHRLTYYIVCTWVHVKNVNKSCKNTLNLGVSMYCTYLGSCMNFKGIYSSRCNN